MCLAFVLYYPKIGIARSLSSATCDLVKSLAGMDTKYAIIIFNNYYFTLVCNKAPNINKAVVLFIAWQESYLLHESELQTHFHIRNNCNALCLELCDWFKLPENLNDQNSNYRESTVFRMREKFDTQIVSRMTHKLNFSLSKSALKVFNFFSFSTLRRKTNQHDRRILLIIKSL